MGVRFVSPSVDARDFEETIHRDSVNIADTALVKYYKDCSRGCPMFSEIFYHLSHCISRRDHIIDYNT